MSEAQRRTAVITGGTKGLGEHLSLEFARRGYRVLALYAHDVAAATKLDERFGAEGCQACTVRYDVTEGLPEDQVWNRPEIAESTDLVLVHAAAAAFTPKPFHLLEWEDFRRAHEVAVRGLWVASRGVLRPMLRVGAGTIVSVLTSALARAPKGFGDYLAAKAGQAALMRSLAAEYGGRGLRLLCVCPGFMSTSLTQAWHPALQQAMKGSGEPSDPAAVAVRIRGLVEDRTVPARAESYDV